MTMALQDAPCWQGGMCGEGWRSLPSIHTWCCQRCRHAKALDGTCWVGNLYMDFRGFERGDKSVEWYLDECVYLSVCISVFQGGLQIFLFLVNMTSGFLETDTSGMRHWAGSLVTKKQSHGFISRLLRNQCQHKRSHYCLRNEQDPAVGRCWRSNLFNHFCQRVSSQTT